MKQEHVLVSNLTGELLRDGDSVPTVINNEYVKIVEIVWPLESNHVDSGYVTIEKLSGWQYKVMPEVIHARWQPLHED